MSVYYYLKWCTDTKKKTLHQIQKNTSIKGILKGNSLHSTTVSQQYRNTKVRKMDCSTTEKKGKGKKDTTKYNCPHGMRKTYCELCGGNGLCEHKKSKYDCAQYNKGKEKRDYTQYKCPYGKRKNFCEVCDELAA